MQHFLSQSSGQAAASMEVVASQIAARRFLSMIASIQSIDSRSRRRGRVAMSAIRMFENIPYFRNMEPLLSWRFVGCIAESRA